MNIKISRVEFEYNSEFRNKYPDVFKILQDAEHKTYYIDNGDYEDIVIFASYKQKKFSVMMMTEFEESLRKLNKKIFYNILSVFDEVFDGIVTKVELANKTEFTNLLTMDLELKKINFIKKKTMLYLYFSAEDELGDILDVDMLKKKKEFLSALHEFNIEPTEMMIYDILKNELIMVNPNTGYITVFPLKEYPEIKSKLPEVDRISMNYKQICFCDIRKSFDKFMPNASAKEFNIVCKDEALYITHIKEFSKYQTLAEYSRYVYNNRNEELYETIRTKLNATKMFYIINDKMMDFIAYIDRDYKVGYCLLRDLGLHKTCCEIMECFPVSDVISLSDLNTTAILSVEKGEIEDFSEEFDSVIVEDYILWVDYFEKILKITKLKNIT